MTTAASQASAVSFEYKTIAASTLQTMLASATSGPSFASFLGAANMKASATGDLSSLVSSFSFNCTAGSALSRPEFSDTSVNSFSIGGVGGVVDKVVVIIKPMPEPESYALLLVGLAVMALMARRRKAAIFKGHCRMGCLAAIRAAESPLLFGFLYR